MNNSNLFLLGNILYNNYYYFFIASGLLLFTSMLGAIILVLNKPLKKIKFKLNNKTKLTQI